MKYGHSRLWGAVFGLFVAPPLLGALVFVLTPWGKNGGTAGSGIEPAFYAMFGFLAGVVTGPITGALVGLPMGKRRRVELAVLGGIAGEIFGVWVGAHASGQVRGAAIVSVNALVGALAGASIGAIVGLEPSHSLQRYARQIRFGAGSAFVLLIGFAVWLDSVRPLSPTDMYLERLRQSTPIYELNSERKVIYGKVVPEAEPLSINVGVRRLNPDNDGRGDAGAR